MPALDGYLYIGCPRCGEIELVSTARDRDCVICALELGDSEALIERFDAKQLRLKAMSRFKQGQPLQGRCLEALAVAIEAATVARKRIYTNTLRLEENDY